jgi:vancomycin aglycone glucosyltransferase
MKFVVAAYGSRGDVEPCVAVGRELLRRGHDVRMAVPPNMLGLIESAGLAAVAYGPDSQEVEGFRRDLSKIQNPISKVREVTEHVTQVWAEKGTTLTELANGADLLLAGITEQGLAANVAEYYSIPLAALHFYPVQVLELGWLDWRLTKEAEYAHSASRRHPTPRWDRWRSRPTTSCACPSWQSNGRNWLADGPSSAR